jgi:hypothetical protein
MIRRSTLQQMRSAVWAERGNEKGRLVQGSTLRQVRSAVCAERGNEKAGGPRIDTAAALWAAERGNVIYKVLHSISWRVGRVEIIRLGVR